jgi:hypothetical protein
MRNPPPIAVFGVGWALMVLGLVVALGPGWALAAGGAVLMFIAVFGGEKQP